MSVSLVTKKEYYYPPQLTLAKKFNNRASFLITTGRYDEGIELLTKALELTEQDIREGGEGGGGGGDPNSKEEVSPCKCKACSLESCLIMEHDSFMSSILDYQHQECSKLIQGRTSSCDDDEMDCDDDQYQHHHSSSTSSHDDNEFTGFMYQRPLLVNKICIEEMHYMGLTTLGLIILFNLALANHLKATAISPCPPKNLKVLQHALKLYELVYQLHATYIQQSQQSSNTTMKNSDGTATDNDDYDQSIGSLRFTMIISNNLGEIHRVAGNLQKHTLCLHHLLSTIMYMVDCKLVVLDSQEMDGFYQNVGPIMLNDICARAA